MVFYRLVLTAMFVGAVSGLLYTAVQRFQVIPIIQVAETYEDNPGGPAAAAPAGKQEDEAAHSHATHSHHAHDDVSTWEPEEGIERTAYTWLTNTLTAIGLAMVLVALMVATRGAGTLSSLTWLQGLAWGLAGYGAFFVAPALGLPPEIPGTASPALEDRQLWWIMAVGFTAAGLLGAAFIKSPWRWAALLLLVVPHLVGAPHLDPGDSHFPTHPPAVAAELTKLTWQFVGATALSNAALWLTLGLTSVWALRRFVAPVDTHS